jgi:hypothetical protein
MVEISRYPKSYLVAFQCLCDCGLEDLGYSGDLFTWIRGHIREILDRAVVNAS